MMVVLPLPLFPIKRRFPARWWWICLYSATEMYSKASACPSTLRFKYSCIFVGINSLWSDTKCLHLFLELTNYYTNRTTCGIVYLFGPVLYLIRNTRTRQSSYRSSLSSLHLWSGWNGPQYDPTVFPNESPAKKATYIYMIIKEIIRGTMLDKQNVYMIKSLFFLKYIRSRLFCESTSNFHCYNIFFSKLSLGTDSWSIFSAFCLSVCRHTAFSPSACACCRFRPPV